MLLLGIRSYCVVSEGVVSFILLDSLDFWFEGLCLCGFLGKNVAKGVLVQTDLVLICLCSEE